jgi:hypothetical protein
MRALFFTVYPFMSSVFPCSWLLLHQFVTYPARYRTAGVAVTLCGLPFSGQEYLLHMARVHGLRGDAGRRRVDEWLERLGAAGYAAAPLRALSALRHASNAFSPHWPGAVQVLGAACLLAVTWTASVLVAARREQGSASAG